MLSTFQCLPVVISSAAKYNRCQCKYNDGNPCKTLFTNEEFEEFRLDYACLDSNDLDMIILGKLSSGLHLSQSTVRSRQVQTERKAPRTDYFHHGRQICMHTFCYMHAISRQRQDKWYCPPHPWVYKETACKCLVVWRHLICPELHFEFCRGPLGLFFLDARHMWGITMWNFCHIIRQLFTDITNISCRQKGHLRTEPSFVFGKPCVHLWRPWLQKQICVGRVNKA